MKNTKIKHMFSIALGFLVLPLLISAHSFEPHTLPLIPQVMTVPQEKANPTEALLEVNGESVVMGLYTIEEFNYLKLTDLSYVLDGSENQFGYTYYTYDMENWLVSLETGSPHTPVGHELEPLETGNQKATLQGQISVFVDGKPLETPVYRINGELYFKLSDFGTLLGVTIGWEQETQTISVNTSDYVPPEPPAPPPPILEADSFYLPIALYHSVSTKDSTTNTYVVTEAQMREDLQYIKDNGYTPIFMSELIDYVYNGGDLPEKPILLTFDDGYTDNYTVLYPLLQEFNMKAVVCLITSFLDEPMTENEEIAPEFEQAEIDEHVLSASYDYDPNNIYDPNNWSSVEDWSDWYQWNAQNDPNWETLVSAAYAAKSENNQEDNLENSGETTEIIEDDGYDLDDLVLGDDDSDSYVPDVSADSVEHDQPYLNVAQSLEMYDSGLVEFQCHTYDFHFSDNRQGALRLYYEAYERYSTLFRQDLALSAEVFARLGLPAATAFSYPGGQINYETAQIVEDTGYVSSFLTYPVYQNRVSRGSVISLKFLTRLNRGSEYTTDAYFAQLFSASGEYGTPNQFQYQYQHLVR